MASWCARSGLHGSSGALSLLHGFRSLVSSSSFCALLPLNFHMLYLICLARGGKRFNKFVEEVLFFFSVSSCALTSLTQPRSLLQPYLKVTQLGSYGFAAAEVNARVQLLAPCRVKPGGATQACSMYTPSLRRHLRVLPVALLTIVPPVVSNETVLPVAAS